MTSATTLPLTDSETGHRLDFLDGGRHGRAGLPRARYRLRRRLATGHPARPQGRDGRGIEISREGVNAYAKGLPVIQGDADTDLADYPDDAFDYVILSQTIQATRQPRVVLEHLLRIGRRAIVSFPNFGHWRVRVDLVLRGRIPVTENMPYSWYDTPTSISAPSAISWSCAARSEKMERPSPSMPAASPVRVTLPWWVWNLLGDQGVFLLKRR